MEALHGGSSRILFVPHLFFKFSLEVKVRQTIRQLFFTVHSKSAVLPILAFEVVLCHS